MSGRILKISLVGLLCTCFAWSASAVPTVKKLGTSSAVARSNVSTTAKSDTGSTARTGVARLNTSSTMKPGVKTTTVTAKPTATKTNTTAQTAESGSDARISLGKYLHGANVVKQNAAQAAY